MEQEEPYIFNVGRVRSLISFAPPLQSVSISLTILSLLLMATSFHYTSGIVQKLQLPQHPLPITTEVSSFPVISRQNSKFFVRGCIFLMNGRAYKKSISSVVNGCAGRVWRTKPFPVCSINAASGRRYCVRVRRLNFSLSSTHSSKEGNLLTSGGRSFSFILNTRLSMLARSKRSFTCSQDN